MKEIWELKNEPKFSEIFPKLLENEGNIAFKDIEESEEDEFVSEMDFSPVERTNGEVGFHNPVTNDQEEFRTQSYLRAGTKFLREVYNKL